MFFCYADHAVNSRICGYLNQESYDLENQLNNQTLRCTAAVALSLTAALFGCATIAANKDDAAITAGLQRRFDQSSYLGAPDSIGVQTRNHVVYLTGHVSAGEMRATAVTEAEETPGVARVVSTIYVAK